MVGKRVLECRFFPLSQSEQEDDFSSQNLEMAHGALLRDEYSHWPFTAHHDHHGRESRTAGSTMAESLRDVRPANPGRKLIFLFTIHLAYISCIAIGLATAAIINNKISVEIESYSP